jgi:hypothetical protein
MVSIVISKLLHYSILVTISAKSFFQKNFNLKWTRIQCGLDLGCCWMLFSIVEKGLQECYEGRICQKEKENDKIK